MTANWAVAGLVVGLAGSVLLAYEAIAAHPNLRAESGLGRLVDVLKRRRDKTVLHDASGNPIDSEKKVKLWLSSLDRGRVYLGLALLIAGALMQMYALA
jgi:hypothetical protein